jgi:hypothetical protein
MLIDLAPYVLAGFVAAVALSRLARWMVRRALGPAADPHAHLARVVVLRAPRR